MSAAADDIEDLAGSPPARRVWVATSARRAGSHRSDRVAQIWATRSRTSSSRHEPTGNRFGERVEDRRMFAGVRRISVVPDRRGQSRCGARGSIDSTKGHPCLSVPQGYVRSALLRRSGRQHGDMRLNGLLSSLKGDHRRADRQTSRQLAGQFHVADRAVQVVLDRVAIVAQRGCQRGVPPRPTRKLPHRRLPRAASISAASINHSPREEAGTTSSAAAMSSSRARSGTQACQRRSLEQGRPRRVRRLCSARLGAFTPSSRVLNSLQVPASHFSEHRFRWLTPLKWCRSPDSLCVARSSRRSISSLTSVKGRLVPQAGGLSDRAVYARTRWCQPASLPGPSSFRDHRRLRAW